jgi:hypothetical protein
MLRLTKKPLKPFLKAVVGFLILWQIRSFFCIFLYFRTLDGTEQCPEGKNIRLCRKQILQSGQIQSIYKYILIVNLMKRGRMKNLILIGFFSRFRMK